MTAPEPGIAHPDAVEGHRPSGDLAWRAIARAIEAAIRRGDYVAGAVLPAAPDLAKAHGVNRHTVRRAFQHLSELGLVTVTRGRGTEVVAPLIPYRIGRRVSFRSNLGEAGLPVSGALIEASAGQASGAVREALRLKGGAPVWRITTLSSANGVPLSFARHALPRERFPDFPDLLERHGVSVTAALAAAGIADYVRLSTRLSARLAKPEEAARLGIARGGAVMQSIGLDALPDGTPIHHVESVFAGARMEMVIDLIGEPERF